LARKYAAASFRSLLPSPLLPVDCGLVNLASLVLTPSPSSGLSASGRASLVGIFGSLTATLILLAAIGLSVSTVRSGHSFGNTLLSRRRPSSVEVVADDGWGNDILRLYKCLNFWQPLNAANDSLLRSQCTATDRTFGLFDGFLYALNVTTVASELTASDSFCELALPVGLCKYLSNPKMSV